MTKFVPASFDRDRVRNGLLLAMGFGEPNKTDDKATFYIVETVAAAPADDEDVPFDPNAARTVTPKPVLVSCAVEYDDASDQGETFGVRRPSAVKITLMGEEYARIKGFEYVVCGGDRYYHRRTEPPIGLGSIDVWILHCDNPDER